MLWIVHFEYDTGDDLADLVEWPTKPDLSALGIEDLDEWEKLETGPDGPSIYSHLDGHVICVHGPIPTPR